MRFTKKKEINEYVWLVSLFALIMALYSVCRVMFYLFNLDLFPGITLPQLLTMMKGGLMFDVSALLYVNALFYLLALLPHPYRSAKGYLVFLRWLFIVTNAVGLALNAIDFKYYPFILKRTTASVSDILKNETNLGSLAGRFLIDYWYVFLIWAAMVYLLVYFTQVFKPRPTAYPRRWYVYPVGALTLALFAGATVVGIRGGYKHSTRPINMSNAGDFVESPEQTAIVLNTPFSVIRTFGKRTFVKQNYFKEEKALEAVFNPVVTPTYTLPMERKNVVIIIWESFAREHSGYFNPGLDGGTYKGYTPFIDSLAAHSLVFTNTYANGRKSIDALPSVTASIPALVLPYIVSEYSSNKINSLAGLLGQEGYRSAFFHGAPNGSMGFSAFTNLAGFEQYVGKNEFNNDKFFDGMWGIWDEEFLQFYASQMGKMPQPFVTTCFTVSSHHPFEVPEKYKDAFPKGNLPLHQCIGYTDMALRKFFATASKQPWYKNTLFVITADHSTSPYHDEYKTNVNSFAIPLLFFAPDGSLQGRDNRVAQQIDIMPTVLSYLKYPKPYVAFGNNLLGDANNSFAVNYIGAQYQFMMGNYVIYFDGKKTARVFDYVNDPALKNDLTGKVDIAKEENRAKGFLQQFNNRMIDNQLTVADK